MASSPTERELLNTGSLADFSILDTDAEVSPDGENIALRAKLEFVPIDEDGDASEIAEWAAFGFIFVLAVLSFSDARPRGFSGTDYSSSDQFSAHDLLECLSYRNGALCFHADYVRGRSMKTDITVHHNGTVSLSTWGRGKAALRWLDLLQGKKHLQAV